MNNIIVLGASGHAKVIVDMIHCMKKKGLDYNEIFLLDDKEILIGTEVLGHKVIGKISECMKFKEDCFTIGIGNNKIRKIIAESYNLEYISLIHPGAVVAEDAEIGMGTVIMAGAVINSGTIVGQQCIINTGSTIDHDNSLADYVHISPGANLGGTVKIGVGTWIGIGSCIKNNIKIGENCIVGAGSVVIRDLLDDCTAIGSPAKAIQYRKK